jgi:hypothetical protein
MNFINNQVNKNPYVLQLTKIVENQLIPCIIKSYAQSFKIITI